MPYQNLVAALFGEEDIAFDDVMTVMEFVDRELEELSELRHLVAISHATLQMQCGHHREECTCTGCAALRDIEQWRNAP